MVLFFPLSSRYRANQPDWSIPHRGQLFQYLASIRQDIYDKSDYYRWEGGYSDYARIVEIDNLLRWLNERSLFGVDVVAHSHGCNVVLGSTQRGAQYRNLLLMNCPVHWHKYQLASGKITKKAIPVRVKFDLVILMDRGGQRFPANTIKEHVLPFCLHWALHCC